MELSILLLSNLPVFQFNQLHIVDKDDFKSLGNWIKK